ncbi:hypothetical protein U0026_16810 [Kluyvera intermedia]|uniref:hypothetical protein n=1 Tax=Kluyvera intermedia TaxID=61648 RepID=UPI000786CADD|nr:hypothetical protein [Kluyvera intermedia]WQD28674.1 hypothetical protein U0026_16810 [Kluyvera intermedia]VDZ84359.1 Uncharacterised protein [Kluyvera intermedia]
MDKKEWVDKLRWLSGSQVIDLHFKLQEEIKRHYKLRDIDDNLERAVQLCEQQIALGELSFPALKEKHDNQAAEYEELTGKKYYMEFYAPAHHGYRQLISIMKKRKNFERVNELEEQREREGWRQ